MPLSLDGSTQYGDEASLLSYHQEILPSVRNAGISLEGLTIAGSDNSDENSEPSDSDDDLEADDEDLTSEDVASGILDVFDKAAIDARVQSLISFVTIAISRCHTEKEKRVMSDGLDKADTKFEDRIEILVDANANSPWELCTGRQKREELESLVKAAGLCRTASGRLIGMEAFDILGIPKTQPSIEREETFRYEQPSQLSVSIQVYASAHSLFGADALSKSWSHVPDRQEHYRALVQESRLMNATNEALLASRAQRSTGVETPQ